VVPALPGGSSSSSDNRYRFDSNDKLMFRGVYPVIKKSGGTDVS